MGNEKRRSKLSSLQFHVKQLRVKHISEAFHLLGCSWPLMKVSVKVTTKTFIFKGMAYCLMPVSAGLIRMPHHVSTSKPTSERRSRLNSMPIRWIGSPSARYLSA